MLRTSIDSAEGQVYNGPQTVPRCNSFYMHTFGAPPYSPSRGEVWSGRRPGDPAPAAVRRSQNG